jgi:hypothetical protein
LVKYCDAFGSMDATTAAMDGFSPMSLGGACVTSAPSSITYITVIRSIMEY